MKTLLAFLIAATAGGYYASRLLEQAYATRAQLVADPLSGQPTSSLALGLEAITGQLTERRLREIEDVLTPQEGREAEPAPLPVLSVPEAPRPVSVAVRPTVVEAWTDDRGLVHVRLADGSEWLRLASGELASVQPCTATAIDSHGAMP